MTILSSFSHYYTRFYNHILTQKKDRLIKLFKTIKVTALSLQNVQINKDIFGGIFIIISSFFKKNVFMSYREE